jgi:DNA-binding response OmpR family regulator
MLGYHFEDVSLVVVGANRDIRSSIRTSLRDEGFLNVRDTHLMARARGWVTADPPDLLIADADTLHGDACRLFHGIRHQELGQDPVVPIIAIASTRTPRQVRQVVDAGPDHVLVEQLTIGQLLERVHLLVLGRKPFVVTADYIGPDRRNAPRSADSPGAPLIEVPNSLRAKATRSEDEEALRQRLAKTAAEINRRKMERDAVQIAWLTPRIVDAGDTWDREHDLERLIATSEDLARRLAFTGQDHVLELCRSLIEVASRLIHRSSAADPRDFKVLPHLSAAINAAFPDDADTASISSIIVDKVASLAR